MIDRSTQHNISHNTARPLGWWGHRASGPTNLWMTGDLLPRAGSDHVLYVEELHDATRDNVVVMHSEADCAPMHDNVPQAPPPGPPPPAPTTEFLVDRCSANGTDWYLAFNQTINVAEFVASSDATPDTSKRYGPFSIINGVTNITVGKDQMKLFLYSNGVLQWSAEGRNGSMQCQRFATEKPTWWAEPVPVPQAPAAPPVVASAHDSMPTTVAGTRAIAPVILGSVAVDMMIDTGCTDLAITQAIADQLIAKGQATYGDDAEYTLADGSKHTNKTLDIATVTIGGHVLHNIHAGIGADGSMLLLGFTILQQISPKFSIDTVAGMLTFG